MIEEAKRDALQRIIDWIMAGGKASDPYVKWQHVYLQEVSGGIGNAERHRSQER